MALAWIEGFDHELGPTDLQNGICLPSFAPGISSANPAAFNVSLSSVDSRWNVGSYAVVTNNPTTSIPVYGFVMPIANTTDGTSVNECALGFALYVTPGNTAYISFIDIASQVEQIVFQITSFGVCTVYVNGNTTPIGSASASNFNNGWNYITIQYYCNNTDGGYTVLINGNIILQPYGINTTATIDIYNNAIATPIMTFSAVGFGSLNQIAGTANYDDVSFSVQDDYYGLQTPADSRVVTTYVNANASPVNFTPLSNTNWQEVSAATIGDSSYNYSSTSGAIDTFYNAGLTGVNSDEGYITGIQLKNYSRKDNALDRQLANYIISEDVGQTGYYTYMTSSYNYTRDMFFSSSYLYSGWTIDQANSLLIGYTITL